MPRKDRQRAKQFIYRDGVRIPRHQWDRLQKQRREANEAERLARLGLARGRTNILTPEEVMKQRRPM